ncbi:MAG: trypsin-like peptidase domain-containing protein [Pirellulaceae bacterium]|nr:trypsin-like peptidase domain-containing protein [Pirellulaceae bacterium]
MVTPSAAAAEATATITPGELAAVRAAEAARVRTIESVYGAVVAIYGNDRKGGGSGVLYDPAGYALTNHHVVAGAGVEGWAGLADGKLYRWNLIGTDPGGDVAIIRLAGQEKFPVAPLADSNTVRVGDWAMAMGNPFVLAEDQRPTVTLGIVSGVHRFQPGQGMNQLVYGDCIQVDSSINPGNSGGPLFNLRGQVIGINGRGSFEERGRVNVGLGYAISANQVKHFIPELLSTKIAQHGTLDAIFGTRQDGVICHTVNLDSAIARAGLALGDKLLAFEGVPIESANQFTNLVTLYPAGWPVEVTFEHEGVRKTANVRLAALPYEPIVKPMAQPAEPEEKPTEPGEEQEKPAAEEPATEKPTEKPAEKPSDKPAEPAPPTPKIVQVRMPKLSLADAGKIRDKQLNREIAGQIQANWVAAAGFGEKNQAAAGLRLVSEIRRGEAVVGQQLLVVADRRVRAEYEIDGQRTVVTFDGAKHWLHSPGKDAQEVTAAKALRDPHFAQGVVLAAMSRGDLANWGALTLDGSDKAQGRLCYRLSVTDPSSEQLFVWLSVFDEQGRPAIQLLKSGVGIDDEEPIPSTVYGDFRPTAGRLIPFRRTLVRSLAESVQLRIDASECALLSGEVDPALFAKPVGGS